MKEAQPLLQPGITQEITFSVSNELTAKIRRQRYIRRIGYPCDDRPYGAGRLDGGSPPSVP